MLQKLYFALLKRLQNRWMDVESKAQHAFRKNYQTTDVIWTMRNVVEKAKEFDVPVFILDGDIRKAYDYTKHSQVINAMLEKGMPKVLIAAKIREIRRQWVEVRLGNIKSRKLKRKRSLIQGSPDAPMDFNLTVDVTI